MAPKAVTFSDYVDGNTRLTAKQAIDKSAHSKDFYESLETIKTKASQNEVVEICFWYAPFIYIEVKDTRWKHYPCNHRLIVSFDLTNGKLAATDSSNMHVLARAEWVPFIDRLVGHKVIRATDCGHPDSTHCRAAAGASPA
jgi:hypothetical protein